jgi:glycosyltransferase involved in cell wall biosynthesis
MRICIINPFYDDVPATVLEVTGRYRHVEALSAALARRGHDVAVVQAFYEERLERRNGVEFHYARVPQRSVTRLRGGLLGADLMMRGNVRPLVEAAAEVRPDVVHMNGVTLLQPLAEIAEWCARTDRPLTATFHGGKPLRTPWLKKLQRRVLKRCHGVFFTTAAHAEAWTSSGLLRPEQVIPCMEVSSTFAPADRAAARARTGMRGHPVFAWNARLNKRKDPVTALKGFELIRRRWPDARLYMIYVSNEWEALVRQTIAELKLGDVVEMRGLIPTGAVEDFLNSADFLIQTSRYEVASFAVLEAMACGVIPVLTDIPPFHAMTDGGRIGVLFPVEDYGLMAQRTLEIDLADIPALSRNVRQFFEQSLSYDAMAAIYEGGFKRS